MIILEHICMLYFFNFFSTDCTDIEIFHFCQFISIIIILIWILGRMVCDFIHTYYFPLYIISHVLCAYISCLSAVSCVFSIYLPVYTKYVYSQLLWCVGAKKKKCNSGTLAVESCLLWIIPRFDFFLRRILMGFASAFILALFGITKLEWFLYCEHKPSIEQSINLAFHSGGNCCNY